MQQQMFLSQGVISAVPGEYYSYASVFTEERPLYALMKCKANKARLTEEISGLGSEVNAFFLLEGGNPRIFSIKNAMTLGLLESTLPKDAFADIRFAPAEISAEQFTKLRASKENQGLVRACQKAFSNPQTEVELHEGSVVALMTDTGKHGMFLVEEITISSIQIAACHVLL